MAAPKGDLPRSRIMRAIKSKNTKPELIIRKYLFSKGYRYRLHYSKLPGKPDIAFPKLKKVILINGCFWHQHQKRNCKISASPASNRYYWIPKLARNKARDAQNMRAFRSLHWGVLVVWECDLRKSENAVFVRIEKFLSRSPKKTA